MPMCEQYVKTHKMSGCYISEKEKAGYISYNNRNKWNDYIIDNCLVYSHRTNEYTRKNFSEGLHTHEFYEMIVYVSGDVEYVKDDILIKPKPYSIIWFVPGQMHTARLLSASEYERHVFYFSKDFFKFNNITVPMTEFMDRGNVSALNPDIAEIKEILKKINIQINSESSFSGLLAKTYITELFGILNKNDIDVFKAVTLTDEMIQIKNYIDKEYASINSTAEIAEKFHYSREHVSRKFKDSFNISISKYISKRRILESLPLLNIMKGADAAYTVGFKSQSSYIAAFVKNMGCLPSEYKADDIYSSDKILKDR